MDQKETQILNDGFREVYLIKKFKYGQRICIILNTKINIKMDHPEYLPSFLHNYFCYYTELFSDEYNADYDYYNERLGDEATFLDRLSIYDESLGEGKMYLGFDSAHPCMENTFEEVQDRIKRTVDELNKLRNNELLISKK